MRAADCEENRTPIGPVSSHDDAVSSRYLDGLGVWLQIQSTLPQRRPARTLVLIFMVGSSWLLVVDGTKHAT